MITNDREGQRMLGPHWLAADNSVSESLSREPIMSFKTILVLLDESDVSTERLDVACGLAKDHGAHLNALAMSLQIYPLVSAGIDAGVATIDVEQLEEARRRAQSVATAAKKSIDACGLLGEARWTSREISGLRHAAALHGRHADLTIAGQPVEGRHLSLREAALEGALFSAGRPALLVPDNWQGPIKVRHVVVAWDASREAARALGDAVHFLEHAERTTIVIVDPKPGYEDFGADPGVDIAPVLTRHCSNVELDRIPSSGASITQALLTHSADVSADLIIMGGYGHSLLRESIFGGVSREMIRETAIPLFLSH
jgi:nucleotide-binding universal stress UspA family protein